MTIIVDDAGSGDLLFGIVIGAYRNETQEFSYDVIDVKFFQPDLFRKKEYLSETSRIVFNLLDKLKPAEGEEIHLCQGYIFDEAVEALRKIYGEDRVKRVKVVGEPQRVIEVSYLDELRNLGYEPLAEREEKRAKNFFHMLRWLKANPHMIKYAKTGWPRLARYSMFKPYHPNSNIKPRKEPQYKVVCSDCGVDCSVHFKPSEDRPVYCKKCWAKRKNSKNGGA
ncbi:MAG: hypothetical protein NWF04_10765 [Candidatus Bathyarchaeota archaeon]|nr:hypothetical protein [Candidatus Bathyarchaeota archaeon]